MAADGSVTAERVARLADDARVRAYEIMGDRQKAVQIMERRACGLNMLRIERAISGLGSVRRSDHGLSVQGSHALANCLQDGCSNGR